MPVTNIEKATTADSLKTIAAGVFVALHEARRLRGSVGPGLVDDDAAYELDALITALEEIGGEESDPVRCSGLICAVYEATK